MATLTSNIVCDNSTIANYTSWASAISTALATFTWVQSNDTGQVQWTSATLTAVAVSGSNATYTYTSLTGRALIVGSALNITSMTHSANNGTFVITALGSGTFTVVNASAVVESGSTGAITAQASAPGSGVSFYEIWQPNDGVSNNFFMKITYGNYTSTTTIPTVTVSIGTATNGLGVLTGTVMGPSATDGITAPAAQSSSTLFPCYFSGAAGRFSCVLWHTSGVCKIVVVERSVNSSGVYVGNHVTSALAGYTASTGRQPAIMQTLVFGVGVAPAPCSQSVSDIGGLPALIFEAAAASSGSFNSNAGFSTVFPYIGYFDYPITGLGVGNVANFPSGSTFTTTLYGSTRTYFGTTSGNLASAADGVNGAATIMIRYD